MVLRHVAYHLFIHLKGRNGDAFEKAYRSKIMHQHPPTGGSFLHVTLSNVGHTQLLDDRQWSMLASVCAVNPAIADDDVRSLIQMLLKEWIKAIQIISNDDNDTRKVDASALIQKINLAFPSIELTYTVD